MISVTAARKIILSMPEAGEHQHDRHPEFLIGKKIFATLWPDQNRAVTRGDIALGAMGPIFLTSPTGELGP
jgi:hypothetical protein